MALVEHIHGNIAIQKSQFTWLHFCPAKTIYRVISIASCISKKEAQIKGSQQRWFHGAIPMACSKIRELTAEKDGDQRAAGDRLFYVLDTDMPGLPNHADVFATVPRPHAERTHAAAWRAERGRLMELMLRELLPPERFRGGAFDDRSTA
jgi:hypothetical protein